MLQEIDYYDQIEVPITEWRGAAVYLVDVATDQLPDRCDRMVIQVGAVPPSSTLAQQVADDSIVGADVESHFAGRIIQPCEYLLELGLFEHRSVE
jgi:hypothetical protein